jgi:pimeloyl-ACP methyl ester carboxylesterase
MKNRLWVAGAIFTILITGCGQTDPTPTPTVSPSQIPTAPVLADTPKATEPAADPTKAAPEPTEAAPEPTAAATIEAVQFASTFEESACPFALPPEEIEGETITCGYVTVPEDRSSQDEATIRLAVVVFKAESDDPQPDPVILLSGGPGEKTAENAVIVALILQSFRDDRDLIVFDQRGVGLSQPALECPEFSAAILDTLDELDPEARLQTMFEAMLNCSDRLLAAGYNLSAYNTTENAADVDDIRQALGYEQLNIYGGSYGTLLAQAVMRDHPEGVRSVVMGAVLPADKSFFVHVPTTVVDATLHLMESCAADNACDSAYPDLQQKLYDTIDKLNADPLPITVTNPLDGQSYDSWLTGDEVFSNLVVFLYITDIIPVLPQAIHDVSEGDFELMTQLSSTKLALTDALSRGMMLSVFCAEDLIGVTHEDYLETRLQMPPQLVGRADLEDIIEFDFFGICQNWPVEEADPAIKQPVVSDIPTLMLEGEFDPVTPLVYAQQVAEHLSNIYLYEFPGVGHDVLVSSSCARHIADQFMDEPLSEPDAGCIEEMPDVAFDLPGETAGEITLEPVADGASGLSSVAPTGWDSPAPGTYLRAENALDQTALIIDLLPMSLEDFLDLIMAQLALEELSESVGERKTDNFTFTLYEEEVQGVAVDFAVTVLEDDSTLMVLLQSSLDEHETLYEAVFLPAVDALTMEN